MELSREIDITAIDAEHRAKIMATANHRQAMAYAVGAIIGQLSDPDKMATITKRTRAFYDASIRIATESLLDRMLKHDTDKILMLANMWPIDMVRKIHRRLARHHNALDDGWTVETSATMRLSCALEIIADWHCAALSKPDKPLNATATLDAYYSDSPIADDLRHLIQIIWLGAEPTYELTYQDTDTDDAIIDAVLNAGKHQNDLDIEITKTMASLIA